MKAIFLDRDGVINCYPGDKRYVTCLREFKFLPGVKKAIRLLNRKKFAIFIISNQAGVGKGIYTQDALDKITTNMINSFNSIDARIESVHYCIHRREDRCRCRKPQIGLIKSAIKRKKIDLQKSFFIGDSILDVMTSKKAGCKSILVLTGKEKLCNFNSWPVKPDYIFRDLLSAAKFIAF